MAEENWDVGSVNYRQKFGLDFILGKRREELVG